MDVGFAAPNAPAGNFSWGLWPVGGRNFILCIFPKQKTDGGKFPLENPTGFTTQKFFETTVFRSDSRRRRKFTADI